MSDQEYLEDPEILEETEVEETEELDFSDNSQEVEQAETDLDPEKIRKEKIKKGEEELREEDFKDDNGDWLKNGEADWQKYSSFLSAQRILLESIGGDNDFLETQMVLIRKTQVYGKVAPFKQYLPGKTYTQTVSEPSTYIPELEKFRELVRKVNDAVKDWAKNSKEVKELIDYAEAELDPTNKDGSRAKFEKPVRGSKGETTTTAEVSSLTVQPYILGKNDWPHWISQNFEEQERPTSK